MTLEDLRLAAYWHIPITWMNDDGMPQRSEQIAMIAERFATEEEVKFRKHPAYWVEVSFVDSSRHSWIAVSPDKLTPEDAEAFERRKAEYMRRKDAARDVGV